MYKIIILLFSVFLIFSAYFQFPEIMQYDSKRLLQILLFMLGGVFVSFEFIRNVLIKDTAKQVFIDSSSFTKIVISVIFITGIISLILAPNTKYALLEFSSLFLLFTLAYSLAPKNLKHHYFLGKSLIATALLFSGIYLTIFFGNYISSFYNPMIALWPEQYNFTIVIDGIELVGKKVLYFDNERFFNHTQTWTMPLLLGLLTYYKGINTSKLVAVALIFLISCWWMLIFASGGRGSIVGISLALILIIMVCKRDAYQLFKNGAITITLGCLLYFIFFRLMIPDSTEMPFLRDTVSGRFGIWEKAIEMWMQNPLFGVGPMHFAEIATEPYSAHPHNFYLQILSEWGLIGFTAFAILGYIFIKILYQNYFYTERNSSNQTIYLAFVWSIVSAFIHTFFSGIMMAPMSQIWLVLILAWFIGFKRSKSFSKSSRIDYKIVYLAYLIFLFSVIYLIYDDIFNLTENNLEYMTTYPDSRLNPRFWVQGLFE